MPRHRFASTALAVGFVLALGTTGCATRTDYMDGVSPRRIASPVTEDHLDAALEVALGEPFIVYWAGLQGEEPLFSSGDVPPTLTLSIETPPELRQAGYRFQGDPPPDDRRYLRYRFANESGMEWSERNQLRAFVRDLTRSMILDLACVEAYREARSPEARREALRGIGRHAVPVAVEWIARDLGTFLEADPAPEVAAAIRETLDRLEPYLEDPSMRALPAASQVILPD